MLGIYVNPASRILPCEILHLDMKSCPKEDGCPCKAGMAAVTEALYGIHHDKPRINLDTQSPSTHEREGGVLNLKEAFLKT